MGHVFVKSFKVSSAELDDRADADSFDFRSSDGDTSPEADNEEVTIVFHQIDWSENTSGAGDEHEIEFNVPGGADSTPEDTGIDWGFV